MESTSAVKVAVVVSMSQQLLRLELPWQMSAPALQTFPASAFGLPLHFVALERSSRLILLALGHVGTTSH